MSEIVLDGNAYLNQNEIPFHFESNTLKLYFENFVLKSEEEFEDNLGVQENQKNHYIIVKKHGTLNGGVYLMHMDLPLKEFDLAPFPHSCSRNIDWYIESFDEKTKYTEMRFRFEELNYFLPSTSKVSLEQEYNRISFDRSTEEIISFDLNIGGVHTIVKLVAYSSCVYMSSSEVTAKTMSEMRVCFDPMIDYEFFYKIFLIVEGTFSFICNRKNLTLDSASLCGIYELGEKEHPIQSHLRVYEKYKESVEEKKEIQNTVHHAVFDCCIGNLMQLIASNFDEEGGTISVRGLHPSTLKRRLIDLQQSLSITSAFEHHVRRFLPEISSPDTLKVYEEIKDLISDQYISNAKGHDKKVAKEIVRHLTPPVSFGDKVRKAIQGYDDWESLIPVVKEKFEDWKSLADIANKWRNELAHEKREFNPTYDVVRAVRLVEHLNYAIILRLSGCTNEEIKHIVDAVLII